LGVCSSLQAQLCWLEDQTNHPFFPINARFELLTNPLMWNDIEALLNEMEEEVELEPGAVELGY